MSSDNLVSRRLAFIRMGALALAGATLPLTLGAGSAFADKGSSSGGGGDSGGSGGGDGNGGGDDNSGSDNSGSDNSGSDNSGSGDDHSEEGSDDSPDVAETDDTTTDGISNSTPLASRQKRRGRKKCTGTTCI